MRRLVLAVALLAGTRSVAVAEEPVPVGGLRLRAVVDPAEAPAGTPLRLAATFENAGATPRKVFFHEGAKGWVFPVWRLTRADGAVFAPMPFVGQTTWTQGLQGEVATIPPGGARPFEATVEQFAAVKPDGAVDWETPRSLPPGEYRVACTHAQADARVPYGRVDESQPFGFAPFETEMREEPGLWTGTVRSPEVLVHVLPAVRPTLVLEVPEVLEAGRPLRVTLRVENPTDQPLRLRGVAAFSAHSKMYGGGTARVDFADRWSVPSARALTIPAHGSASYASDLSAAPFEARGLSWGIYELVPEGHVFLGAAFEDESGKAVLSADGVLRSIRRSAEEAPEGLRLSVAPKGGASVEVSIRNESSAPVALPRRLAYPVEVSFALRDAEGRRGTVRSTTMTAPTSLDGLSDSERQPESAVIVEGLSWDGDAFDPLRPLAAADVVTLAPGESVSRTFDLARLVHGGLPPGRYSLTAAWRSVEDGRRVGAPLAAATGRLVAEPVVIQVR